jgi:hypothetical protein
VRVAGAQVVAGRVAEEFAFGPEFGQTEKSERAEQEQAAEPALGPGSGLIVERVDPLEKRS